jgi:SAM-dependent methyltransferase
LAQALRTGFEASSHAKVVVRCASDPAPKVSISYELFVQTAEIADVYRTWLRASEQQYFGRHPDAKVMAAAGTLPVGSKALDIGAGTGRNSLPLARAGLRVDAVELTPDFVGVLREEAARGELALNVREGDAFDPALELFDASYSLIVASEVVSSHVRNIQELREFFDLSARKLSPAGLLVCNVFLAHPDYVPSALVREISPALLSTLFTADDLAFATRDLPLALVSDEPCLDYEREHLPPEAWPPTSWFEPWASGKNLFDVPGPAPAELRWLVYRKV